MANQFFVIIVKTLRRCCSCTELSLFDKLHLQFSEKHALVLHWGSLSFTVAERQLQRSNSFPDTVCFLFCSFVLMRGLTQICDPKLYSQLRVLLLHTHPKPCENGCVKHHLYATVRWHIQEFYLMTDRKHSSVCFRQEKWVSHPVQLCRFLLHVREVNN